MKRMEAEKHALRITQSWPTTRIELKVGADQLESLDSAAVDETISLCVRRLERSPSIAQFLSEYHRLRDAHAPSYAVSPEYAKSAISFGEYMSRLYDRAAKGDRDAIEMSAIWERNLGKDK